MTDKKALFAALTKAQAAMGKAQKNSKNPHFRSTYADLGAVMDACMPALIDNGFCLFQPIGSDEHGAYVETILAHSSGESISCRVPLIVGKNDMQGFGSAVTYARRYGLMSMAGIAPEDDDGNAAAKAPPPAKPAFDAATEGKRIMAAIAAAKSAVDLDIASNDASNAGFTAPQREKLTAAIEKKRSEVEYGDSIPY